MESTVPADSLTAAAAERETAWTRARREARAGIYLHVPFCATRCTYCDFATGTVTRERLDRYMEAIEAEIRLRARQADGLEFTSVFLGGGTPSLLPSRHMRRIFSLLRDHYAIARHAEITLEANPESVRDSLAETWAACGINRVSMGVQSFDEDELRTLGRIHGAERPAEAVLLLRRSGFARVSLDLMFGYPGSAPRRLVRTVERALALGPGHLSVYCFVPERRTPLGRAALGGRVPLPSPDEQSNEYRWLVARLARAGFARYETSNFCLPGEEARHNLVYWLRRPYLGLGPSAHGFLGGARYGNHRSVAAWSEGLLAPRPTVGHGDGMNEGGFACEATREPQTAATVADEIVMLGLRLEGGLRSADHAPRHWDLVRERYASAFRAGIERGRLESTRAGVRIPPRLAFVADDTIAWLAAHATPVSRSAARAARI